MEDSTECPLCLEALELDDMRFFPCMCGYQVCRFCWHRIRTNENGTCPQCRRPYSEDPANYKPLSSEELIEMKKQKKLKEIQNKQKYSELRKQLANVRVIQKNLVFVVGLPLRLTDAEELQKLVNFKQYGKVTKIIVNTSTKYAGSQGPSACAYITYQKAEDALKVVKAITNSKVEGRAIKASLGTTKYCSYFLKKQPCPKQECMYLHELADEEASFTKEEIQVGKHLEYEQKLHEQMSYSEPPKRVTPPDLNECKRSQSCSSVKSNEENETKEIYINNHVEVAPRFHESKPISVNLSDLVCTQKSGHFRTFRKNNSVTNNVEESKQPVANSFFHHNVVPQSENRPEPKVEEPVQPYFSFSPQCSNHSSKEASPTQETQDSPQQNSIPNFSPFNNPMLQKELQNRKYASPFLRDAMCGMPEANTSASQNNREIPNHFPCNIKSFQEPPEDELGFDPCQVSLKGLQDLMISEAKETERFLCNTPFANNYSGTRKQTVLPQQSDPSHFRNNTLPFSREPPPGFSMNNFHLRPLPSSVFESVISAPHRTHHVLNMPNDLNLAAMNFPVQKPTQNVSPFNNQRSLTPESVSQVPSDWFGISANSPQNHTFNFQPQQPPSYYNAEHRMSSPVLNHLNPPCPWRNSENSLFNQSIPENRANFLLRAERQRVNELATRQLQQNGIQFKYSPFKGSVNTVDSWLMKLLKGSESPFL